MKSLYNTSSEVNDYPIFENITTSKKWPMGRPRLIREGIFRTTQYRRDGLLIREYIKSQTVNNLLNKVPRTLSTSSNCIKFNKSIMAKHPDIELNITTVFKSKMHVYKVLNSEKACREHLEQLLWNGEPICPHCGTQRENHYQLRQKGEFNGLYKCKDCRKRFTVRVGTMFEDSPIPLRTWLLAIYEYSSDTTGINSLKLHRDLEVSQKTAWYMLQRIRNACAGKTEIEFDGTTQVDETYVGGKNRSRNKGNKIPNTQGRSLKTKVPVFGMISEDGFVHAEVVKNTKWTTLRDIINSKVKPGSTIVSDGYKSYARVYWYYNHVVINHSLGIYKVGKYHTNQIEGFWNHLKRTIRGTYVQVSKKHLSRYCDECSYRYNTRHMTDGERFNLILMNANERLTYKQLIA